MEKIYIIILNLVFIIFSQNIFCQVIIEKSNDFKNEELSSKKIIFINPEIKIINIVNGINNNFLEASKMQKELIKDIKYTAKKSNFEIECLVSNELSKDMINYYSEIVKLYKNILQTNALQDHPFNSSGKTKSFSLSKLTKKIFVQPPKILPIYSSLSKKYNTPYFALLGYYSIDARKRKNIKETEYDALTTNGEASYSYLIIVNIDKGEIIYRESKKLPFLVKEKHITPILFDTFTFLKENM